MSADDPSVTGEHAGWYLPNQWPDEVPGLRDNVSEYLAASDGSIAAHFEYDPFGSTHPRRRRLGGTGSSQGPR